MEEEEFKVIGIETGEMRVLVGSSRVTKNTMSAAIIKVDGNKVGVGSGWTIEQREQYFNHPEEIVGKKITVQFFEKTKDQNGKSSLRFPVVKWIHGIEREI